MGVVKGTIALKDNATAVLRGIRKEQSAFRREVEKTKSTLKATWDKKYQARIEATAANRALKQLHRNLTPLRKKVATVVAIKDLATSKVKSVATKVKNLGKAVASPIVKLKDATAAGISKISSKLKSLAKSMVIPVTVAATVTTAALGASVASGMQLELQQTSMSHFIQATNKDMNAQEVQAATDSYIKQLRENANATPFETSEVIKAGSRAVAITGGDTASAMDMVKLAEDMAAASGGTATVADAIEALADAKMGEMERLKSFGFKVSAEEFEAKGFEGVQADLQDFFGGAAEKLATTGSGLWSTIKGKLKSNVADFGLKVVDQLKPVLTDVITMIDNAGPAIEKFATGLASNIGKGIKVVSALIPKMSAAMDTIKPVLDSIVSGFAPLMPQLTAFGGAVMAAVQKVATAAMPVITSIISTVQTVIPAVLPVLQTVITNISNIIAAAAPIISGLVTGIGTVVSALAPVFKTIFDGIGEKVGSVLSFVGSQMGWIQEIIGTAAPVISSVLSSAWSIISPILDVAITVFKLLFSVTKTVFNGIVSVVSSVWEKIQPIVEGVANGLSWIKDKVTGLFGGGGGSSGGSVGTNAEGTNNWRGGVTWVGEKGPELIDLPRGTRILPNKESVSVASQRPGQAVFQSYQQNTTQQVINAGGGAVAVLERIDNRLANIEGNVIAFPVIRRQQEQPLPSPVQNGQPPRTRARHSENGWSITLTIAKLADTIIVREDGDIDAIGEAVAKKVIQALKNMPQPA